MEKEKKTNLLIGIGFGIIGSIIGASIPILINKIKSNKKIEISKEKTEENNVVSPKLSEDDKKILSDNLKKAKEISKTIDQLFLVPIKKEYIEKIGFGMLGAIKTSSGHDEKGDYNIRLIIGAITSMEVKEYSGCVEGFKVFTDDLSARTFVTEYLQNKDLNKSKSREEYIKRLSTLLQENKDYEEKGGD